MRPRAYDIPIIFAAVSSSKTYARGAICGSEKRGKAVIRRPRLLHRSTPMLDVLMLALAFGLFALAIGYTYACERL
jgi:hypothetical protein